MANKTAVKLDAVITSATIKGGRVACQTNNRTTFNIRAYKWIKRNIIQAR